MTTWGALTGGRSGTGASLRTMAMGIGAAATLVTPAFSQDDLGPPEQITRNYVEVDHAPTPQGRDFEGGETVRYVCAGARSFAVRFDTAHGVATALVRYANNREAKPRGSLLLVSGPTGSGVRYTNDAAIFHTKGMEASLTVPERAGSPAFEARDCAQICGICAQSRAPNAQGPRPSRRAIAHRSRRSARIP